MLPQMQQQATMNPQAQQQMAMMGKRPGGNMPMPNSREAAMRGLLIFHSPRIQSWNEHCGSSKVYGDLRKQKIYQEWI